MPTDLVARQKLCTSVTYAIREVAARHVGMENGLMMETGKVSVLLAEQEVTKFPQVSVNRN